LGALNDSSKLTRVGARDDGATVAELECQSLKQRSRVLQQCGGHKADTTATQ